MAGSFGSAGDDDVISGINVTPLVDVVLVLLIIFMITAPAIYQSAIRVQLPQASTGEAAEKSALEFTITKDGKLALNKEVIEWSTLSARLQTLRPKTASSHSDQASSSDQTAIINADKDASHGTVIKLIDALRAVGIMKFALNTESSTN